MNLIKLPITILDNIFLFINDTDSYANIRISCKSIYFVLKDVKRYYNNKSLKELFVFSDGELGGYHVKWYINRCLESIVFYVNSKKNNEQTYYYSSGNIKLIQHFKYGKLNGLEKQYSNYENMLVRQCEYKDNVKVNDELTYNKDGTLLYIKTHINKNIYKLKYRDEWKEIEATFVNEILHGKQIITYKNNELEYFKNNKIIKTFNYGQLTAISKYENNNLIEKFYIKNGKKDGWDFKWHSNNKLKSLCYFNSNNYEKSLKIWNNNYNFIETIQFSNNLPHGLYKSKSKFIKKTIPYVNGIIDGYITEKIKCINLLYYIKFKNNEFDRVIKKQNDISCEEIFLDIDYFSYTKYKYGKKQYSFKLIKDYINFVKYDNDKQVFTFSKILNLPYINTYV
jgi:antitoxin component YwqK of YwqJK toxin-antitoxin module